MSPMVGDALGNVGWARGKLCGKPVKQFAEPVKWVCAHCGRCGIEPAQLCYPVRVEDHQ